jgi:uncharacterized protein (TIGR02996 family)
MNTYAARKLRRLERQLADIRNQLADAFGIDKGGFRDAWVATGDHHVLLVYADWLEERGDPRAERIRNIWPIDC